LILIAINYFYGDRIESWWNSWRSGEKFSEIGQNLIDQTIDQVQNQVAGYSLEEIEAVAENLPEDIQLEIDNWLLSQDLNEYGDPEDTVYSGGTPTFDEATGEATNRFELILNKFPDLIDKFEISVDELKESVEQAAESGN
jgi:hypothetical protein